MNKHRDFTVYYIYIHHFLFTTLTSIQMEVPHATCADCLVVGGCSKLKCDANFFDDDGYPENGHFSMLEVVWGDKANRW